MKFKFILPALLLAVGSIGPAMAATGKPNIQVMWGDDIGQSNISNYTRGLMGYRTPISQEAASFSLDQVMEKLQAGGGSH